MRLTDQLLEILVKWLPAWKVSHHSYLAALRELCTMDSMSRKRFAVVFLKKKNGFQIPDIIGKMAKSAKVIYE